MDDVTPGSVGWWLCFAAVYAIGGAMFVWSQWSDTIRIGLLNAKSPRQFKVFLIGSSVISALLWPLGLVINLIYALREGAS